MIKVVIYMQNLFTNPDNRKKLITAGAAALVLVVGWQLYSNLTYKPETEKIIPLVRTVTVGETKADGANVYPGQVMGRYESRLAFQVGGKIVNRMVNLGDKVSAGQILMTLDPKDVNQAVEASNAQLASAIANQKLAADNAQRFNTLYANGAVSAATRDQYNTQLEAANAALRQAQAQANANNNQLEYTMLRSDVDGVVAAVTGEIGMVTAAGTPMVTVVKDGEREVQINVPENALGRLTLGEQADVSFWALPDLKCSGTIREIAPMADPMTKTYKVCVAIDSMPADARLGMTAKVSFNKETNGDDQFVLPGAAIYQTNDNPSVWVVRNNHAQLIPVQIAGYNDNNVIISGGLTKGDVVITAGIAKLVPDQEVRLAEGGEQ